MRFFIRYLLLLSLASLVSCRYAPWVKRFFLQRPSEEENEVLMIVTMSKSDEQEVTSCEIITNAELMQEILKVSQNQPIEKPSSEEMKSLLEDCSETILRKKRSTDEETRTGNGRRKNNSNESRIVNTGRNNSNESHTETSRQNNSNDSRIRENRRTNSNDSHVRENKRNNSNESPTREDRLNNSSAIPNGNTEPSNYNAPRSRANRRNNFNYRNNSKIPSEENRSNADRSSENGNDASRNKSAEDDEIEMATSANGTEDPNMTSSTTEGYNGLPVILPGTKWCGAGDLATDYDDLGLQKDSDRCCRAHDLCNDTLAPGAARNNLTNTSPFTKLNCECDDDFYNCLDSVNSFTSNAIGNMYFNILRRECFEESYPLTSKCKKYRTFFKVSCQEYERDMEAPKVYQWVPAKMYRKIPLPGSLSIRF